MMYTVNTAIPPMATNKTHLSELLTSFAMSFLDLSNNSEIRHLLIYKEQGDELGLLIETRSLIKINGQCVVDRS
jgi:hypothetical protein